VRILYIANAAIPSEKAHTYQILKMCEAFEAGGLDVELAVPCRFPSEQMKEVGNIWRYYGINERFKVTTLLSLDFFFVPRLPLRIQYPLFYLQAGSFYANATLYSLLRKAEIIYSRDPEFLFVLSLIKPSLRPRMYYEAHTFPGSRVGKWLRSWMGRRIGGLIVITNKLKELYVELGVPDDKILVARDGVDLQKFRGEIGKEKSREKLGLPIDKKIVCYTGHLFPWKGVYTFAESAKLLRQCLFVIVGGMYHDIRRFQEYLKAAGLSNVEVVGYVQPSIVPDYLFAADALILPNSAKAKIASHYTSPLKLFEYMASRRTIIASDLPSLGEVLRDGENAILVEPDDPRALAEGIKKVLDDPDLARSISEQAYSEVSQYSWEERARRIIRFVKQGPAK
jgi:glycosyltransferase involved in cell wall biosynthesis